MSSTASAAQRLRLKQVPIDVWSTREKLALASSVARSGDQNWYSVSRPLKAFGEPNRPPDWFSQKNCALQYSDMLEKVETPKRKRGERGEDTAQESIVRKLTTERMEELKKLIEIEREKSQRIKDEIELIKSGKVTQEKLREIWTRMKEEEAQKKKEEEEHQKWLQERDAKIAEMKISRANLIGFAVKPKPTPSTPTAIINVGSPTKVDNKPDIPIPEPQVSEPLTIEVEETSAPTIVIEGVKDVEKDEKATNLPICPSTSPLLTSLLQSPSNSTVSSSLFSPLPQSNKEVPSPTKTLPISSSSFLSSTTITPTTSKPIVSQKTTSEKSLPTVTITQITQDTSVLQSTAEPTEKLSEPLKTKEEDKRSLQKSDETYPSSNIEVTIIPIVIDKKNQEVCEAQKEQKEQKVTIQQNFSEVPSVQIKPIEEPVKSPTKDFEMDVLNDIKQEVVETKEADEPEFEEVTVKQEAEESDEPTPSTTDLKTPGITPILARIKRRKPSVPLVSTPIVTPTRRSGRVKANRELKLSESDERENTPNAESGAKKFAVGDETTDASMSEESLDAAIKQNTSKAPSITESTPNSPASSTMHSEDAENLREYKQWKKSIMLLWRQAATHKYASLFLHPVTDDEAKGYSTVVYRPQDLTTIRKKIENSTIKTTAEFQRDIMLMFQNAIMYNSADHEVHQMAVEMQKEILEGIEDFIETQQQGNQSVEISKSRVRRSGISTPVTETHDLENSIAFRRKSRTSTDTDPGSSSTSSKPKAKKKP